MQGWKTWLAAISMVIYAIVYLGIYLNNWSEAVQLIIAALALIGIGHKLDKLKS